MRPATKWYCILTGLLGLSSVVYSALVLIFRITPGWSRPQQMSFWLLLVLCWLCCCLPLYIREDCTVDLSFICILASALLLGPESAVVISAVAYPFVVVTSPDGKSRQHIFNSSPLKTLFNIGDHALSYWLGGVIFYLVGGVAGSTALPGVLLPAALYILSAMVLNAILALFYFVFEYRTRFFPTIFQMFLSLLPSVACAAPIGYFLAMLLSMRSGVWLALLFMLPLLLARYSFKLFLSSKRQQDSMVETLTAALEAKDTYTKGHSSRVSAYAVRIAREMGFSDKRLAKLRTGAIFHDIGKIGIPDAVLQKPARLDDQEWSVIRAHPTIGVSILENIDAYKDILDFVRHHHERYDGGGYPDGLSHNQVSLDVYILGAADAYDAITSDRPYCAGRSALEAARILRAESGKQFHPDVAWVAAQLAESGELERCIHRDGEDAPEPQAARAGREAPC